MDERGLIEKIFKMLPSPRKGDDAVAIELEGKYVLASVDGVSIEKDMLPSSSPEDFGWYACALSLSDLAACGGSPLSILASLTFERRYSEDFILEFLKGVETCASNFSIHLDGGDLNEGRGFVADLVAVGVAKRENYVTRRGAKPGDLIFTTGSFGDQGAAISEILSGREVPEKIRKKVLRPVPKIEEGKKLGSTGKVTSMIDSSDGLYESLLELSKASGVLMEVDLEKVPKGEWYLENFDGDPSPLLFGGGELELVFTSPPEILDEDLGFEIYEIGRVVRGRGVRILEGGKEVEVNGHGWRHFS